MFEGRQTILAYYVEMRVSSQFNSQVDYVFAVAAENDIGDGEFSNASSTGTPKWADVILDNYWSD